MFDFNNIEISNTADDVSRFGNLPYMLEDSDDLINCHDSFESDLAFRNTILEFIGNELKDKVVLMGNLVASGDIKLEEVDGTHDRDVFEYYYCMCYSDYDKLAKNPKIKDDKKLLALCAMLLDEYEVGYLCVAGDFDVEIEPDDPEVGYYGSINITDYNVDYVGIVDAADNAEVIVDYHISYPRKLSSQEQKKTGQKYDMSKVKNTDVGKAWEGLACDIVNDFELDEDDYYTEPPEPDYDDYYDR